jgi:OFA family oxalate/formate antiporter-like MFS transporter
MEETAATGSLRLAGWSRLAERPHDKRAVMWPGLPRYQRMTAREPNRWVVAAAAVILQLTLGTVHAWSVFRMPLSEATGWTNEQITLAYSLAILLLGCSAPIGGLALARLGPRRVGLVAAALYGLGTLLAGFAAGNLWLLYLGYGVVGGVGLGLGFVVPVTVVLQWFPDHRGLLGGVAVAGFGAGALIVGPLATWLMAGLGVFPALATLGPAYLLLAAPAAWFLRQPPTDFGPAGSPVPTPAAQPPAPRAYSAREALGTWQYRALWALLFLNVSAGSALLSQAAAMAQELVGASALAGGAVVAMLSMANAVGRLLWTGLSDLVGRRAVFLAMFLLQTLALPLLPHVHTLVAFTLLGMLVLLCYGGGFGTLAAFAADYFGSQHVGMIFGLLMTACGCGGVAGPLLLASVRQLTGSYGPALTLLVAAMLVGAAVALVLRPPVAVRPSPMEQSQGAASMTDAVGISGLVRLQPALLQTDDLRRAAQLPAKKSLVASANFARRIRCGSWSSPQRTTV